MYTFNYRIIWQKFNMDHWKRSIWWLVGDTPKSSSLPPPSSTYRNTCQEMRLKMKFKCQLTCCHQQISPSAGLLLALADVITHALCAAAQCLGDLNGFEAKRSWGWHSPQYQPPEEKNKISEMQVIQEKIRKEIMEKFITNTSDWYAKMLAAEQRCFTRKQNI